MRAIVLAGGESKRWSNFEGVPKHLAIVENETLLFRTCRQLLQYTDDVIVIGPDHRYSYPNTELHQPNNQPGWDELNKFKSSDHLWSDDRTALIFGDVWFSDDAITNIANDTFSLTFFLRQTGSVLTGCKYGEIFAISFSGHEHERIQAKLSRLRNKVKKASGWALLRSLTSDGTEPRCVTIDDWTEDFDFPQDLIRWRDNRMTLRSESRR